MCHIRGEVEDRPLLDCLGQPIGDHKGDVPGAILQPMLLQQRCVQRVEVERLHLQP